MKKKYLLLCVVFIPLALFILNGMIPATLPPGLNLTVSDGISPGVGVFVLNNDHNAVTSLGTGEWFFLQQKGLPEGTTYGFRVIDANGFVTMPVYETFTAKAVDWVEANKYYRDLGPGKYTVELLTIRGGSGTVVARTSISILDTMLEKAKLEQAVRSNCSRLMAEPVVDVNGWSREGKIAGCVAKIAAEFRNPGACNLVYQLFNSTTFGEEDCIRAYALATGDVSVCDLTGMPKTKGFCKAKATRDWTQCRKITCDISCAMENIDIQQDLCIQWYAIENRDTALCNEIKSTEYGMKGICLNLTAQK
ncbi:MAG: hypothetical protein V1887_02020 [Candidatus Aenigmatarchaeota archaeon]